MRLLGAGELERLEREAREIEANVQRGRRELEGAHMQRRVEELKRRLAEEMVPDFLATVETMKALAGEIENFTGISDPYEAPENPDVMVDSSTETIEESLRKILGTLE